MPNASATSPSRSSRVPGTESTNSWVWSTNGGITSAMIPARRPAQDQCRRARRGTAARPRPLEVVGRQGKRDRDDDRDQDRHDEGQELAEEQPQDEQRRREQHRAVERVDLPRRRHPATSTRNRHGYVGSPGARVNRVPPMSALSDLSSALLPPEAGGPDPHRVASAARILLDGMPARQRLGVGVGLAAIQAAALASDGQAARRAAERAAGELRRAASPLPARSGRRRWMRSRPSS